ncbi:hypothetical protein PoB_002242200 [Plakobranchus ocellatus]|uniref:Uncharacterized protein n=1 Tax=Plakobranchus ocellatus TaxID=259542 RepID=A0AAV3ZN15_9GAST|nr:hypothetical protein PoB_002242200 [Plakobranchus ocellatus]
MSVVCLFFKKEKQNNKSNVLRPTSYEALSIHCRMQPSASRLHSSRSLASLLHVFAFVFTVSSRHRLACLPLDPGLPFGDS